MPERTVMPKPILAVLILAVGFLGLAIGHRLGVKSVAPPAVLRPPPIKNPVTGDPPVIIHGGSLHLDAVSTDPYPSGGPVKSPISIPVTSLTNISMGNYYLYPASGPNPKPVSSVNLSAPWEIDVCEQLGLSGAHCPNGFRVCTSADCKTAAANKLWVESLDTQPGGNAASDIMWSTDMARQYDTQRRFRLLKSDGIGDAYHPRYLQIYTGASTTPTTYTCGTDPNKVNDWASCWVALGS